MKKPDTFYAALLNSLTLILPFSKLALQPGQEPRRPQPVLDSRYRKRPRQDRLSHRGGLKGDVASFLDHEALFLCFAGVNATGRLKDTIRELDGQFTSLRYLAGELRIRAAGVRSGRKVA